MWFFNQKRADRVAQSISHLIHTLSAGRENHGPTGPERLLRELATLLSEDTIIGQRVVKLLMATSTKAKFLVSLATTPDHSSHRLTFDGRGIYSGFSWTCRPPVTSAWSGFTRQALPALFGPLELIQYLRGHFPMPLLIGMHIERVPVAVVQIDREREHVCRRGFVA